MIKINKNCIKKISVLICFILLIFFAKNVFSQNIFLIEEFFSNNPNIIKVVNKVINIAIKEDEQNYTRLASSGTENAPITGTANNLGYYKMPSAPNGEYAWGGWNTCETHRYGSKTLIDAIYTAALKWHAKYPQYTFRIGDLNGPTITKYPDRGHQSHGNGVDVDIVTYGNWSLQINAPTQANIDLGEAFIDTGVIKLIIFGGASDVSNPRPQLVTVTNTWKTYANSKGLQFNTYPIGNHDNHFHVRINDQYRLAEYRPAPCY